MTDTSTSSARGSPLLVPLFALLGLGGLTAYGKADDAHVAAEWAHCGDLPLTWQMYLSAYGALACGILTLALFWWLARRARRHDTWVGDGWPGKLRLPPSWSTSCWWRSALRGLVPVSAVARWAHQLRLRGLPP